MVKKKSEKPKKEKKQKSRTEKILPKKEKSVKIKKVRLTSEEKRALREKKKKTEEAKKAAIKRDLKSMGFFERMRYKKKLRRDKEARRRAEDLATLPKNPVARFFAHLSPKRVFRYWFSLRGLKTFFKFCFACLLLGIIAVGGLFLYFKKDVADIKLSNIAIS